MGIAIGGRSVRGPARMADSALNCQGLLLEHLFQDPHPAGALPHLEPPILDRGQPRAIVAAILQPAQPRDQNRAGLMHPCVTDDSTHRLESPLHRSAGTHSPGIPPSQCRPFSIGRSRTSLPVFDENRQPLTLLYAETRAPPAPWPGPKSNSGWDFNIVRGSRSNLLVRNEMPTVRHPHCGVVEHYLGESSGSAVDAARRAGYPWTEQMSCKLSRKVRETRSSSSQKRPKRGHEVLAARGVGYP